MYKFHYNTKNVSEQEIINKFKVQEKFYDELTGKYWCKPFEVDGNVIYVNINHEKCLVDFEVNPDDFVF